MAAQGLFDALAGAAGAPINRPALNAYVTQGQAMAGLRSAQTEEALLNAQRATEEADAASQLEDAYTKSGLSPSDAHLAATISKAHFGNAKEALDTLISTQQLHNRQTLSDPNQLNTPAQTAAMQGISGKVAETMPVTPSYAVPAGMADPVVHSTPLAEAQAASANAAAGLHTAEAMNPAAFHPRQGAVPLSSDQSSKLTQLLNAGVIGPAQMYSLCRNPSLIDAAYGALQNDPTGIAGVAHAKQNLLASLTSGTMSRGMIGMNTAVQHMALVPGVVKALNNGDVQFLNSTFNGLNAQLGGSAPVLAQQLSEFLGREVVNAIQQNGGGEREREAAQQIFANKNAPNQLTDAAAQAAQLLGGRAHSVEQDYIGTMSIGQPGLEEQYRHQFRSRFLTPETRKAVGMDIIKGIGEPGMIGAHPAPQPAAGSGAPAGTGPGAAGAPPAAAAPAAPPPMELGDYLTQQGH